MFLTIQGGDYTINLTQIVTIDWTDGDEVATVNMSDGSEYCCEEDDFYALRKAIGLDR